jgi:hypothetical protein
VRALVVHPRDHDLVIATHGRGVYILDDVRPLRALAAEPALAARALHVFDSPVAIQHEIAEPLGYRSTGDAMFFGENRAYGALLSFWIGGTATRANSGTNGASTEDSPRANQETNEGTPVTIEILDGSGQVIRRMDHNATRGLNRVVWDLETTGYRAPGDSVRPGNSGPQVVPGDYTVRVRTNADEASGRGTVAYDPRSTITLADRRANFEAATRLGALTERMADAASALQAVEDAVTRTLTLLGSGNDDRARALTEQAEALQARVDALDERLVGRDDHAVLPKLRAVTSAVRGWLGAPTPNHRLLAEQATSALDQAIADVNSLLDADVARFRTAVDNAGLTVFPAIQRIGGDS